MYKFRVFRAIDDLDTCNKFKEGHIKVLTDYGITNITTNNTDWFYNPSVYGIIVESESGDEIYGGIRVHIVDNVHPLPVEEAIGYLDSNIYRIIASYAEDGTGELCGLWNSKDVAGMGISMLLVRAGISIVNQLNLSSLFTICADYTYPMVKRVGFIIEDSLGDDGKFIYPNENYIARVLRRMNAITLDTADEYDRNRMFALRDNPVQIVTEQGAKDTLTIDYRLLISK